ncbi:FHA domain-containing protein [Fictibacillus phosphorivorans]|uniref:FHA domain-containing protein n=1 Tax=Fictibacillus phosphorivorans TaxID=1221500 RepID=UPI00203CB8F1|nr:FHA domain-containing protein [Fictibacillus phosphorivorans]MCM3718244.1 FHA domain-containing protein [Fictibacillus phosphorivorans]MCM3775889.1 FHA domain-containing protein [Fictibacillus phosphorivorans]
MKQSLYIRIEAGDPYDTGSLIPLKPEGEYLTIGRSAHTHETDISLLSPYVSRNHAEIFIQDGKSFIRDLDSKHGTELNQVKLDPNVPKEIHSGDVISLAKGVVLLTYLNTETEESELTMEFTSPIEPPEKKITNGLHIIPERRQISIDGEPLFLSGKHTDLLVLLYRKKNQAVSSDEIKIQIWPERMVAGSNALPDVGKDEINALVYRLRKKLGSYGDAIVTVPRYGYMLQIK